VEITRLELTTWTPPAITLELVCSRGTYVRSLAHDLGQALGCGAHLTGLTRLASGDFRLEDAFTLVELTSAAAEGGWTELLHPIDAALSRFPALHVDADAARRICSGQAITAPYDAEWTRAALARVYSLDGRFLALAAHDPAVDAWLPRKVFRTPEEVE
jgi:tRNA pseudouridine55 synthase